MSRLIRNIAELSDNDFLHKVARFQAVYFESKKQYLDYIEQLDSTKKVINAQLFSACLLHKGENIIPIPGIKKEKYLIEDTKAIEVNLTK